MVVPAGSYHLVLFPPLEVSIFELACWLCPSSSFSFLKIGYLATLVVVPAGSYHLSLWSLFLKFEMPGPRRSPAHETSVDNPLTFNCLISHQSHFRFALAEYQQLVSHQSFNQPSQSDNNSIEHQVTTTQVFFEATAVW